MTTAVAPSVRSLARHMPALLAAAAVAAIYVIVAPRTGDLAAQTFRVQVAPHDGLGVWNNYWFGGHHLPGYSVLFPLFGAVATPTIAGAIASFAATSLFLWIVRPRTFATQLAGVWFVLGMAATYGGPPWTN